jgi:hypothetical protein
MLIVAPEASWCGSLAASSFSGLGCMCLITRAAETATVNRNSCIIKAL